MPASLAEIVNLIESSEGSVSVSGLCGSSGSLLLSRLASVDQSRAILVLTPSQEKAQEMMDGCELFFDPEGLSRLQLFPEPSSPPYSRLSPDSESAAMRMRALHRLAGGDPAITIAPVCAAMRRTPPAKFIADGSRTIRLKEEVDPSELTEYLSCYGYEDVGLVEDEGAFARRGGIIDLWPPTLHGPVRIELDGDLVSSMRLFDPASQRSREELRELRIIPVREIPFDEGSRRMAAANIRRRAEEMNLPARERRATTEAIREGIAFAGIDTMLSFFHESAASIFDFLPGNALVIVHDASDSESAASERWRELCELRRDTSSPERIVEPAEIALPPEELAKRISDFKGARLDALIVGEESSPGSALCAGGETNADIRPLVAGHKASEDMLLPLARRIGEWRDSGTRVVLTCHTEQQAARLRDLFRWHGIELSTLDAPFASVFEMSRSTTWLKRGRLAAGFRLPADRLAVVTDEEIFGAKVARRRITSRPIDPFTSFTEIAEGDAVVHEQHGIGRYVGLVHLEIDGKRSDFLLLEYLGGDKLYLPVYRLNLVGRYIGSGDSAPMLDRLGGTRWSQVQKKVDASIRLLAGELIDIYARRELFPGHPFPEGGAPYEEFCAAFPYDETPDQERAIDDVMRDMSVERPMDRLICGDVGYGKTEVAMRAAFRAAMSGKQVAVLVPTTVLALQHHETFKRRFNETAASVRMLSRFLCTKERKDVLAELTDGKVDIVIGTHALLQKSVRFRDLGLLIVDEEHRFGVRHKERIKKMKSSVDVITLTATPIPRTLNFSLSGIRDISIINTPPADRLSVTTHVTPFDEGIVRQAIMREIARGGQVFFVHNRVETIRSMHERLKKLVPEARTVVGHGQMAEGDLEKVMIDFLERRADVLLCTTIIESGLDIPNANTIIIHRADRMGLAQLYQLRGRVGRSNLRAYAYLLTPEDGEMSAIAKKRLTVLKRFTELGSGFQIAMHDLEFRGAGNILGAAQSGHIAAIGYELYAKLLDRAVRKLRGKRVEDEVDPELSLKVAAYLPEEYVPDQGTRIDLYRRLANRESPEEIEEVGAELCDRFGELPREARDLLKVMEIKILARKLRMRQITFDGTTFGCRLDNSTPLEPAHVLAMAERELGRYRLVPPDRLLIAACAGDEEEAALSSLRKSLSALLAYVSEGPGNEGQKTDGPSRA